MIRLKVCMGWVAGLCWGESWDGTYATSMVERRGETGTILASGRMPLGALNRNRRLHGCQTDNRRQRVRDLA